MASSSDMPIESVSIESIPAPNVDTLSKDFHEKIKLTSKAMHWCTFIHTMKDQVKEAKQFVLLVKVVVVGLKAWAPCTVVELGEVEKQKDIVRTKLKDRD